MSTGVVSRCPRCQTVVGGDYKFCPACAYRLRVGLDDEPAPARTRSPWSTGLLVATGASVLLAATLLGVILFSPGLFEGPGARVPPTSTPPGDPQLAKAKILVADIPAQMVELDPKFASDYPLREGYLRLDDAEKAVVRTWYAAKHDLSPELSEDDFLSILAAVEQPGETIEARVAWPLRVMKYEVTCGQYAEFLLDVEADHARIPDFWLASDKKERREDVDVRAHVPTAWLARDDAGEATGWRLADADRNLPVTDVSVVEAQGFAEWAGKRLHVPLRLPFVIEWTRAARAGERKNVWPWGDQQLVFACNNLGIWQGTGRPQYVQWVYSEPVGGEGGATSEGLFAMAGNVSEWAIDHDVRLLQPSVGGPPYLTWKNKEPLPQRAYIPCGGSFRSGIDDCQVEVRPDPYPANARGHDDIGFRLVADVGP